MHESLPAERGEACHLPWFASLSEIACHCYSKGRVFGLLVVWAGDCVVDVILELFPVLRYSSSRRQGNFLLSRCPREGMIGLHSHLRKGTWTRDAESLFRSRPPLHRLHFLPVEAERQPAPVLNFSPKLFHVLAGPSAQWLACGLSATCNHHCLDSTISRLRFVTQAFLLNQLSPRTLSRHLVRLTGNSLFIGRTYPAVSIVSQSVRRTDGIHWGEFV